MPGLIGGVVVGATRQVSLGMYHSCSVRDGGRVLCWGANNAGQLGIEANVGSAYPTPVPALLESGALGVVTQLALGNRHACALRDDGRVLCWGGNYFGQLATVTNTGTEAPMVAPVLVDSSSLGVAKQVAVGDNHSCALRQDGRVFCWGKNWDKQLGSTATSDTFVPREINSPALGVVRQLALGVDHSCALRDDGRVLCWGDNSTSQLGAGQSGLDSATPVLIDDSALGVVRQLALGSGHSCALRDDGRVLCWGNNYSGQLGVGMNTGTAEPLPAPQLIANGTLGSVQRIAAGNNYTCALREDGQVLCWGDNEFGQLGTNTSVGTNDPNPVPAPVQGLAPLIP
ncbi:MAG TPA: hypothetical protein VFS43_43565 [Polyangiaceae bacterium]|nr:hypothetical protein [Polyangiaceae bacterium]